MIKRLLNVTDHSILVCEMEEGDQIDRFGCEMLSCVDIDGVLPMNGDVKNGRWNYDLSGLTSIRDFLSRPRDREDIQKILVGMKEIMDQTEEYMIPSEQLLYGVDYVYIDDGLVYMILPPVLCEKSELADFIKEMAAEIRPIPGMTCRYRIRMNQFVEKAANEGIDKEKLNSLIQEIEESREEPIAAIRPKEKQPQQAPQGGQPQQAPQGGQPQQAPQGQPYVPQGQPQAPQGQPYVPQGQPQAPQGQPYVPRGGQPQPPVSGGHAAEAGETIVLSPTVNGTVVWNNMRGMFTRQRTGERFMFDRQETMIGKDYANTDFYIQGNAAISRRHAKVINREEKYFISDNNSTNHTFVNGIMVGNEEVELHAGDIVKLADETFLFQMV